MSETPGAAFGVTDDTPEPDPATFDVAAWVSGVTGTIRSVKLYQRADLLADVDDLTQRLRVAESVSAEDRGLNEESPSSIRQELEQVAHQFEASAVTFKVQGRSDDWREKVQKRLKKAGVTDDDEVLFHQVAESVVEPKGVTVEVLRALAEVNETQYKMLVVASSLANNQPPRVDLPFSRASSKSREGRG